MAKSKNFKNYKISKIKKPVVKEKAGNLQTGTAFGTDAKII